MVGKSCTVCRRCSYAHRRLSFFTYPRDSQRRYEWLIAVDRLDLMEKLENNKTRANHRICEVHFEGKYMRKCTIKIGRKFLTSNAFPTLCLPKPSMIESRKPQNFTTPPSSMMNAQSVTQGDKYTAKQSFTSQRQTSRVSKYNLGANRQDKEETINNNILYKQENEVYFTVDGPPGPTSDVDPSQFCESIMKVSQSTQTPIEHVIKIENIREYEPTSQAERVKTDYVLNDETSFLQSCSTFLTPSLSKLVKWNFSAANGKQHINFKLFALNLYYSSNLYNFLKDMLSLPTRKDLKYFLLPKTTRISELFLNAFRCKINNMSTRERICSFSVGSILLKPRLYYDIKYDRIVGLQDMNGVQNTNLAKYAIILMVQGILVKWQQPIAYVFISEYDNNPEVSIWIDEVLAALINIGLDIRAFVSDPRSEFLYTSESRFVTPDKTYFTINGMHIFYTYDTRQLQKIVKNNLKSCDFYYGMNIATSSNVAFFKKLNQLCNLLNAKDRCSKSRYKKAFSNKVYQRHFLNYMFNLFQNLKVARKKDGADVTENMKFIENFQITINSVLKLYEDLSYLGVQYLFTSRLSHNCLNRFLSHVKQSECADECTPRQFNRGFVRSFVFNMLKKPVSGHKLDNPLDAEHFCQQLMDDEAQVTEDINQPLYVNTTDYRENLPDKNAFVYICRYCYLKSIEVHMCDAFQSYLNKFKMKQEKNAVGYLCSNVQNCNMLPPNEFIDFLIVLESKFKEYINRNVHIGGSIGREILDQFNECGFGMPCPCFPIDYLKVLFIRLRLYFTIKKNNKLLRNNKSVKSLKVFSL